MKKQVLIVPLLLMLANLSQAQRFLTEVFSTVTKTSNIVYANNISFLPTPGTSVPLAMDIYEPTGDTMSKRPLVVFMHTGSYLPICINQTPTGSRNDSAAVEICTRLAKLGYVVANIDYRLGWNPAGSTVDIRRGSLIQAVYRSIQDAKAAVRYFRKDAATTNLYKINSNYIALGGQGTGGYIAVNYNCLKDTNQIKIPKFISNTTAPASTFPPIAAGQPYVNISLMGDLDGYGGNPAVNTATNSPGYNNDIQFAFNLSGCVGDSSWVTPGLAPMVGFHVMSDPFAPYGNGIVFVPGNPPQSVVDVSGSGVFIPKTVALGNNDAFKGVFTTDPYSIRANSMNGGAAVADGLFPFALAGTQAGPWEWWDSTMLYALCPNYGLSTGAIDTLLLGGLITNPNMSKAKGMAYIDTVIGYLAPRMNRSYVVTGVEHIMGIDNSIQVYPNPADNFLIVKTQVPGNKLNNIQVVDLTGRMVKSFNHVNSPEINIDTKELSPGTYLISINSTKGRYNQRLVIQ
jgi:acetyl esterase/lipase